jgi:transcription elongation factor B subunit 1
LLPHQLTTTLSLLHLTRPLTTLLLPAGEADGSRDIDFPDITSAVLEKVIEYWHYKVKYQGSAAKLPEFHIPPELALQVLIASDYLEC